MMRQFILLRQWDGGWSLFAPTMIASGLFLLASGPADWDPAEDRWTRPDPDDYDSAERTFEGLHSWQGKSVPQSSSAK
jgi:hypothetical protein